MARPAGTRPLILRAVSRMAVGGVQRGLLATLARADRERFDFHVLCTKKEGRWAEEVGELGIPLTLQKTLPPWHPFQIARLAGVLKRIAPDLVHIHMAPMVIPVAAACKLAGIRRYVVHWHSNYTDFWMKEQNAFLRGWERRLTQRASGILAVSRSAAEANAALMGVPLERVAIVPNGIDRESFEKAEPIDPRAEWGIEAERPLVVQVARYLPSKRNEDFIEAAAAALRGWPQGKPRPAFALIGSGEEGYRIGYEALIEKYGLAGDLILAGTREDVPGILKAAQAGVLASENEGFGQVILEYFAAGLPVAAANIPSVAELAEEGRAALLVPPRSPERLGEAIVKLLSDAPLRENLVAAGREMLGRYDWTAAARGYEAIYERALGG